ncbi:MAG: DUF427 domain-containing protein [Azospirillaceae bacterium]
MRPVKQPGPDHPITVAPCRHVVRVRMGGQVLAESDRALELREAGYPPVLYLPRQDVDLAALGPSERKSWCPYKGEATYHALDTGAGTPDDVAWSYDDPLPAMQAIAGALAFYPDKVTIETV